MAIRVITESGAEPTNANIIYEHEANDGLRDFILRCIFSVTARAQFSEKKMKTSSELCIRFLSSSTRSSIWSGEARRDRPKDYGDSAIYCGPECERLRPRIRVARQRLYRIYAETMPNLYLMLSIDGIDKMSHVAASLIPFC
jgi:hypothetical protein